MAKMIYDYDGLWYRGAKSDSDPGELALGYYWMGYNLINVGGLLSTRPGHKCIVTFPDGNLQGAALFRPRVGLERMLCVIDGIVYNAEYPFIEWDQLDNILLSPDAKQVYFQMTLQSARRLSTGFTSAIETIAPKAVLFIQDGGRSAPAWFDGSDSGQVRSNLYETPVGGPMAWVGDRLWVAQGALVKASDIGNPFSFREIEYLGGTDAFVFDSDVTGMSPTPGQTSPQLMVFTENEASLIQANIRNRSAWATTPDMQLELFKVGCTSHKSIVNHFGSLNWFSPQGQTSLDSAVMTQSKARLPIRDNEMAVSKTNLHTDKSTVAGGAFGQFVLMSVPFEDIYNTHTWVMNAASLDTLNDDSGPSWTGIWNGTRPVEWVYGSIAGEDRIYHVSKDNDGKNRLWQSFQPQRSDNGCPIYWQLETRGYFGRASGIQVRIPGSDVRFAYADVAVTALEEDTYFGVFYAGGMRGAYKPILSKKVAVSRGSLKHDEKMTSTTKMFAYKPQSRRLRTEDVRQQTNDAETGSCPIEREEIEDRDESFQLLIAGHGPATIRWIRSFSEPEAEDPSGEPDACVDEVSYKAVKFDGNGAAGTDFSDVRDSLAAKETRLFTSTKTVTLEKAGVAYVGSGYAESIVSQAAADHVATRIATRQAEAEIIREATPFYSAGEGFDE